MPEKRAWDGVSYDRVSGPMAAMGLDVLARLPLQGDESVLDAGCGSGRITEALIERLPRGRVIAFDLSASMLEAARSRLEPHLDGDGRLPHVEIRQGDLLELQVDQPVDAVFSTATFHWVDDHDLLFRRLRAALRTGGRLVAQCGGESNITTLRGRAREVVAREPYAQAFESFRSPWNYAGPDETRARLLAAGFSSAECWLAPAPQRPEHPREFLSTIVLGPYVQHLAPGLRDRFMDEVMEHLGEPVVVDYVRLNIDAVA
jgi:trans-aconitate 2-methyltransferase